VLGYLWRSGSPADPQAAYLAWVGNPLLETGMVSRLLTVAAIVPRGLALLFFPARQSADYCYNQIPVEEGVPGLLSLVGIGVTMAGVAALLLWRRRHPAIWLALAWGALTWLLTSNALVPIGAIFAERFLYLPAIGSSLVIAALLDRAAARGQRLRVLATAAGVILVLVSAALFTLRRADWSSDEAIFAATAASSPRCARAHSNHGLTLQRQGRLQEATAAYERALAIAPGLTGTGLSLTSCLLDLDRFEAAAEAARSTALRAEADVAARRLLADLLVTAGLRAIDAGDDRRFLVATEAAAAVDPDHATAHFNLALHAYRAGHLEQARLHTRDALRAGYKLPEGFLKAVGMEADQAPVPGR
jgi:tetratricopeptide (TPR) repeat protein